MSSLKLLRDKGLVNWWSELNELSSELRITDRKIAGELSELLRDKRIKLNYDGEVFIIEKQRDEVEEVH